VVDAKALVDIKKTQLAKCLEHRSEFQAVLDNQKLGIALQTLGMTPIYGVREPIEAGTCGWYVWCGPYAPDADFFQPLHVSHLAHRLPIILPYLGLAVGHKFIIDESGYEDVWFEEQDK